MAKDRFGEEREPVEKPEESWVYLIRPNETAKAFPMTVRCCLCRQPMVRSGNGWCFHCNAYPMNVAPVRFCELGHAVDTAGWCRACVRYRRTELLADGGEWRDTGRIGRLCTKEENQANARRLAALMSSPGWPEKQVPLREDCIPRRWTRAQLRTVGETPSGFAIVIPENAPPEVGTTDVPF